MQPIFETVSESHAPAKFTPGLKRERTPYSALPIPYIPAPHETDILPHRESTRCRNVIQQPAPPQIPRLKPIALPPQIPGVIAVTLNPVLRLGARFNGGSRIDMDFASTSDTRIEPAVLMELAVFPGLPSLTLLSRYLPWAIPVHASGRFVTVGDVLQATRRSLDMRVTEDQVEESMGRRIRCMDTNGNRARGLKRKNQDGMTRLHLLQGRTRFAGLSESTMGCEVWVTNFV
ncbi:hypothetical protein DFH06DRAFT_1219559 [Mycena polygramma]|nr:hypothetical protein DFH06DRAFT_1219559 [Mycena polygramma]